MKKIFAGTALLAIAAAAWAGGDVWKTKPYSQWDQKDIATILQSSPWAKPAQQVQGAWHPDGTAAADTSNIGVAGSGDGHIEPFCGCERESAGWHGERGRGTGGAADVQRVLVVVAHDPGSLGAACRPERSSDAGTGRQDGFRAHRFLRDFGQLTEYGDFSTAR